jgi:hypothetical protein
MPTGVAKNPELKVLRIKLGLKRKWPDGRPPIHFSRESSWNKGMKGKLSHLFGKRLTGRNIPLIGM